MEKYKKFTDPGTGINPFVPIVKKNNSTWIAWFLRQILVSPLLFLVKLLFMLCFSFTYTLLSIFFSMIPLWLIRRTLERYLHALAMRAFLFLFGFYYIESMHINTNNRLQLLSTSEKILGTYMNHGDLIICNHISYVELFYLAFRYCPTFATLVESTNDTDGQARGILRNGFIGAFLDTINEGRTRNVDASKVQTLPEIVRYCKLNKLGPVVVFPESVTSNGRAILSFQNSIFNSSNIGKVLMDEKVNIHLIGFQFHYQNFSPCFHQTSSFLRHLYGLSTNFYNKLVVKHIHLSETERKQLLLEFNPEKIRNYLSSALKLQCVASSRKDKQAFLEYWVKTQNKNYAEKEE
jgi:1-acyl-sn-glycerol-3-phosphate acyltransferase